MGRVAPRVVRLVMLVIGVRAQSHLEVGLIAPNDKLR